MSVDPLAAQGDKQVSDLYLAGVRFHARDGNRFIFRRNCSAAPVGNLL